MSKILFSAQYYSIEQSDAGVEFVRSASEVLIVPLTSKGTILLTIEPSAAFGGSTLILPGGNIEPNEQPIETANRELQEEIGYRADQLDYLGELRPFSKYLTVRSLLYLAQDLTASRLVGDEAYPIEVEPVAFSQFESLITAGRLRDARVIAALYMARAFCRKRGEGD